MLEVQEADYTRRFGGSAVERSDVVDLAESNAGATVITDLRAAANIPDATYDCVILTQTLHVIAPMTEAVAECHRILKPGGVLLVTLPCVSRVCLEYGRDGDFWRVTPAGARQLFERGLRRASPSPSSATRCRVRRFSTAWALRNWTNATCRSPTSTTRRWSAFAR